MVNDTFKKIARGKCVRYVDLFDVDASIQKSNICFREYCCTKNPHKQWIRRGYLTKRLSLRSRQFVSRK